MLELCHGSPDPCNPAVPTLSALANVLFDPNGARKAWLGPFCMPSTARRFSGPQQSSLIFKPLWRLRSADCGDALCTGSD